MSCSQHRNRRRMVMRSRARATSEPPDRRRLTILGPPPATIGRPRARQMRHSSDCRHALAYPGSDGGGAAVDLPRARSPSILEHQAQRRTWITRCWSRASCPTIKLEDMPASLLADWQALGSPEAVMAGGGGWQAGTVRNGCIAVRRAGIILTYGLFACRSGSQLRTLSGRGVTGGGEGCSIKPCSSISTLAAG